ncbi:unnamed protein product [Closterium sp. Naga37s-1]|nr:unnamed protein product [Closterium sp. Naga37s-1]
MAASNDVAPASFTKTQLTLYAPPDRQHERVLHLGPPGSSSSGRRGSGSTDIHVQEIGDPDEQAEGSIAMQREKSLYGSNAAGTSQGARGGGSGGGSSGSVAGPGSNASSSTTGGCGCPLE